MKDGGEKKQHLNVLLFLPLFLSLLTGLLFRS